jgi:5-methylcytosine-specific restriction endonuclease McrA
MLGITVPLISGRFVFVQGACAKCAKEFCSRVPAGGSYPRTCSRRCAVLLSGKAARKRRRARLRSIEHAPYRDEDIFEADGYRCQECGVKCRVGADRSTYHPRNPTVDHIVPTTWDGSSDTPVNLQTLCFRCNTLKGDRHAGQLKLIG